jgi:hypothetical protein
MVVFPSARTYEYASGESSLSISTNMPSRMSAVYQPVAILSPCHGMAGQMPVKVASRRAEAYGTFAQARIGVTRAEAWQSEMKARWTRPEHCFCAVDWNKSRREEMVKHTIVAKTFKSHKRLCRRMSGVEESVISLFLVKVLNTCGYSKKKDQDQRSNTFGYNRRTPCG